MGFLAKSAVVAAVLAQSVLASPAPAGITPAPLAPRANTKTFAWYTEGGQTSWEAWLYDADSVSYTTSGNYFRRCPTTLNCLFYTQCSSGWMIGASATSTYSTYCGAPSATGTFASNFCSWHVLQPSQGAVGGGQSWFWCDQAPLTGYTFFAKAPAGATPTAVSTPRVSSAISLGTSRPGPTTTTPGPTGPTTTSPPATSSTAPASDDNKSSTPVGAIAGGVVGGVAVLGAIAFAIIFLMRRDKAKKASAAQVAQSAPLMGQHNTAYQPNTGYPPQDNNYYGAGAPPGVAGGVGGGYPSEQKPAPVYYPPQQPMYPQGAYDPHVQPYTAPSPQPGAAELGGGTAAPPAELPAGQGGLKH